MDKAEQIADFTVGCITIVRWIIKAVVVGIIVFAALKASLLYLGLI